MVHQIHPNIIRQGLFLVFLILIGIIIVKEMFFLLGAFLGAVTLYVIMRPAMLILVLKKKWKKWIAALLMMGVSVVILMIPMLWFLSYAITLLKPVFQNPDLLNQTLNQLHEYIETRFSIDLLTTDNLKVIGSSLVGFGKNMFEGTMSSIGNIVIMYCILYFMLIETTSIEKWLRNNIPFKNKNVQKSMREFRNLVYSNALGIPLVALIQGGVGLLGYWILGVEQYILMGLLTAICSVIPLLGSMLIYLPLMVFELSQGRVWQGIGVGLWGFILIGSVDNLARLAIQKKLANIHPLITLFGAFIGVNMFGFLGIIFGPLMISMFFLLIKIYIDEFGIVNADEFSNTIANPEIPLTEQNQKPAE